ncbi:MAG: cation:proton antiporter [Pseudomonadales bacterium]|nr:cation:proton antiporter [Pseudomonadales bacterium]
MESHFFSQLTIILSVSLLVTTLFQRLRLPSILAYILAGCMLGPTALSWVTALDELTFLSEFGVVFLLFTLGLEFSLARLITLRRAVFLLGGIQVLVCTLVFFAALYGWGTSASAGFVLAGALAFSSTAIVSKLLADRKELGFDYSQLAIGMLLFQDLAALVFLIVVPTLSTPSTDLWLPISLALGKGVLLFLFLILMGKWVLPVIYKEVARARSDEIFVLTTLVIVLLGSYLLHELQMSMALGGFIIGMMLGGSQFRHQVETDIRPFKDIFLGLFFVSVGLQIDLHLLFDYWHRILVSAVVLLIFKAILIAVLARLFGENKITALRTGLVLSQGGEFAFALITMATLNHVIPHEISSFMLLVVIASMVAAPFIINNVRTISGGVFKDQKNYPLESLGPNRSIHALEDHVIVGGYGRIGQTVSHFLENNAVPYIAMDTDVRLVSEARDSDNHNVIYGDCTKLEMLKSAGIEDAQLVVLSFRFFSDAVTTIECIRHEYPDLPIIVRAHHENAFEELVVAGANHVVPEMLEASFMVATQTLLLLGFDEETVFDQIKGERDKRAGVGDKPLA